MREGSGGDPEDVLITVDMNFLGFLASVSAICFPHSLVSPSASVCDAFPLVRTYR